MAKMQNPLEINFRDLGGPVYIGRPKGEATRKKFRLDEIDRSETQVIIEIPDDIYSINSSYFLGMFGPSIKFAGSREAFLKKFKFSASDAILSKIDKYIVRALHEQGSLF